MAVVTTEPTPTKAPPFGVNELRLNARLWFIVTAIVLAFMFVAPRLWKRLERFDTGPDYRIPYALSNDYWLYQRRIDELPAAVIPVIGDSVVWGEYVRAEGTLTHFLSQQGGAQFANCGVNGVYPLALEGLVAHYAGSLRNRKVLLQCNLLWMSSPKADLSTREEQTFNHPALVPQAFGAVPCYRADAATRLGYAAQRRLGFFGWVNHVDDVYFDQMSIPKWTLAEDDHDPPGRPHAWDNPFKRVDLRVPGEPANDPQRGPASPRHHAWDARGAHPQTFEWVPLDHSLQWAAFQRTVKLLQGRGNDMMVILGPFNEHMVAPEQRAQYAATHDGAARWLADQRVPTVVPQPLPSGEYADASHPLTEGYADLARRVAADTVFAGWLRKP